MSEFGREWCTLRVSTLHRANGPRDEENGAYFSANEGYTANGLVIPIAAGCSSGKLLATTARFICEGGSYASLRFIRQMSLRQGPRFDIELLCYLY